MDGWVAICVFIIIDYGQDHSSTRTERRESERGFSFSVSHDDCVFFIVRFCEYSVLWRLLWQSIIHTYKAIDYIIKKKTSFSTLQLGDDATTVSVIRIS